VIVGDVALAGGEGRQQDGRVIGVAEPQQEIGDGIERQDEIGERAEQRRTHRQRSRAVVGAMKRRHGVLAERDAAQRLAGLGPEAFPDDLFVAHGH